MTRGSQEVDKAVSRTLRDTLNTLQRTAEDLHQALNDLVAACGSSRPANALPPILRAQTSAASLSASLEVLSRFVAMSMQAMPSAAAPLIAEEETPTVESAPLVPAPAPADLPAAAPATSGALPDDAREPAVEEPAAMDLAGIPAASPLDSLAAPTAEHPAVPDAEEIPEVPLEPILAASPELPPASSVEELPPADTPFDVSTLLPEEQDLHRRANRVAKVCMQDIKMLRPNEVLLGREHRDICLRLRDDIEKAHKEYDRRFQSILGHPVDYFYDWMVEILGGGDAESLGEYPYPSPVLRR